MYPHSHIMEDIRMGKRVRANHEHADDQVGRQGYTRHRPYRREAWLRETPRQQEFTQKTIRTYFSTDEDCEALFEQVRWPDGVACPRCYSINIYRNEARRQFDCRLCYYRFSVTSKTWLHKTRIPFTTWLATAYEITEDAHGISANELMRKEELSYEGAWTMAHTIRRAMLQDLARSLAQGGRLGGTVEVDETWTGGKVEGWGQGFKKNKILTLGIIERGGNVYFQVVSDRSKPTLHHFISIHVDTARVENLYTDEFRSYWGIDTKLGVRHRTVNHGRKEYARGPVHTNSIESMWASWSRAWKGTYHHISRKYAGLYMAQLAWCHNNARSRTKVLDLLKIMLSTPDHMEEGR